MNRIIIKKYNNINGDLIYRLDYEGMGYLDFQIEDGVAFLIYVEVEEEYQNKGIATKLLERFFQIISKKDYSFDMSGYLEAGDKYLKAKLDDLVKKYNIDQI